MSSSDFRGVLVAVALVATIAAASGVGARASYGTRTTGDEPHYLLTALSLAEDRDLDVSDEIEAGRFRPFSEIGLDRQSRPLEGGRLVSPHDPLLPALIAPAMAAGGWIGAKLVLAATAGFLAALTLWVAVRRFDTPVVPTAVLVGLFSVSAPLSVYGSQVYPEVPAALATMGAVAAGLGLAARRNMVACVLAVSALPWLSVKYAPVAAALAVAVAWRWSRAGDKRAAAALVGALVVSGIAFAVAHQAWYGGWTPYGVGDHFVTGEFGVVGLSPDFAGRSRRLIGLLVDREFGLAAWQPAWLLALPAVGALVARRPPGWELLALPLAAGWLNATFVALTMHGWWWPGRQVVVVVPLAVVAIAAWVARSSRRMIAAVAAGAVGVLSFAWVTAEALNGRLTMVVDFYETGNPLYGMWRTVLPDYRHVSGTTWVLHGLWVVVAALALQQGWIGRTSPRP